MILGSVTGPYWDDKPVAIIGGGRSLVGFDFNRLRERFHVLAIKGSIFDIPFAAAGFGLDVPRYLEWRAKLAAVKFPVYWAVPEKKFGEITPTGNVTFVARREGEKISTSPSMIYGGGSSGFGGVNVALLKQAKKIVLLGYDYSGDMTSTAPPGHPRAHRLSRRGRREVQPGAPFRHNDQHYGAARAQNSHVWAEWANNFKVFSALKANGIEIINGSPLSAIDAFPRMGINEALNYFYRV